MPSFPKHHLMNLRLLFTFLLLSSFAHAHPGHEMTGFTDGILHPLQGLDHLSAMIAVGILAAQLGGRNRWILPASFVSAMGIGLLCGLYNQATAWVEALIAISILVLGTLVAGVVRIKAVTAVLLVAACAWVHGLAHGTETPLVDRVRYVEGIFLSTAILHLVGLGVGTFLLTSGRSSLLRSAGLAVCTVGLLAMGK